MPESPQPTENQPEINLENISENHRAGFVSLVGRPNVGKSTMMNQLVGERLSIITSKAQTTRHRIMGILNGSDYQVIYSDTPGMLKPQYELHKSMMRFVHDALEDSDVVLFITDVFEKYTEEDQEVILLKRTEAPVIILINKIDVAKEGQLEAAQNFWQKQEVADVIMPISAMQGLNIGKVFDEILNRMPLHPPFFPKDALTDKPERFFAAEMIREKIFLNYKKEVPYSTEVVIEEFKETDDIIRIRAEIFVERQTQKGILIGKGGAMLKTVGIQARTDMETFFQKQVHLETFVKVAQDWRKKTQNLNRFGYNPK